jgi:transcriptional regulator with XRE-family HTH domain
MTEPRHPVVDELLRILKVIRLSSGMTLEDVADRAGIHRTHLGLLERNERAPSVGVAIQIARALGYELSDLLKQAELVDSKKLDESTVLKAAAARHDRPSCLRNEDKLNRFTGLDGGCLLRSIASLYHILDTIDSELTSRGSPPIAELVELANLSSMVGNIVAGAIAKASDGLYERNRPHAYPDLIPKKPLAKELELKMALETNRPKGHLPKAGNYISFRYVLGRRDGSYTRGKETRGNTVWIWEVKVGRVREEDFDISNTPGDSGKTAVIKTTVFNDMPLVYFDPSFCPNAMRGGTYPGFN